jgi:hypothetical protein
MAAFLMAAMTWADDPEQGRWAASSRVVSQTWCKASMPQ